jgi:tetratricopeptide (TPR) repeat protein
MESGDLTGAQKELEEVIKSIPDNLLAQRKLADLYVYQGRSSDALQRYRAVLTLNPGDKEIPSLITDLEAGRDITSRLPKSKAAAPGPPKTTIAAPAPKPAAPVVPAAAAAKPSPAPPKTAAAPAPTTPPRPAVQPGTAPAPVFRPVPPPAAEVAEAIEDIVELEPLERPEVPPPPASPASSAPVKVSPPPRTARAETPALAAFDLSEPAGGQQARPFEEPEAIAWEPPAQTEEPAAAAAVEEAPAAPAAAAGPASSDDINTSTLAELYITQGFFEKAIEIYEGMLADAPTNAALQQKLDKIRAMAGVAERNAAFAAPEVVPAATGTPAGVFAGTAQQAAVPAAAPAERPAPEPKTAEAGKPAERAATTERAAQRGPQTPVARRKETIDRLESWLKNVIKEKP